MFLFCSHVNDGIPVANEEQPDRYALGLLVDLRELCEEIGDKHHEFTSKLWGLLRQVANPNVHGLDKELTFRVKECDTADVAYSEELRAIPLNGNIEVARGAFSAAVRCYPTRRWLLLWGSYIVECSPGRVRCCREGTMRLHDSAI